MGVTIVVRPNIGSRPSSVSQCRPLIHYSYSPAMARLLIEDQNQASVASPISFKPFKLLRLPLVALQKVLKLIDLYDIFTLSLCSTRTLKILKFWKSNIKFLLYQNVQGGLLVINRRISEEKEHIFYAKPNSQVGRQKGTKKVKIGGIKVQCVWKDHGIQYNINTSATDIQVAVHNHIQQVFNITDIGVHLSPETVTIGSYPNISHVTDLLIRTKRFNVGGNLYWENIKIEVIEEIIQKYPNLKSLVILGSIDGIVQPDSNIFKIQELAISGCGLSKITLLENFNGRCGHFGGLLRVTSTMIIEFVRKWILGQKHHNLEFIGFNKCPDFISSFWINRQTILDELRPLAIPVKPRENKTHHSRLMELDKVMHNPMWPLLEETLNFQRSTDQKMATLTLTTQKVEFRVWNNNHV